MPLTLFAENLLEAATVTTPFVDLTPLARLYDRDLIPYEPAFPQAWNWGLSDLAPLPFAALGGPALAALPVLVDLGPTPKPVSYWAMPKTNASGTVTLKADNANPPTTTRDSVDPAGAPFARLLSAPMTFRYWLATIPTMAVAPQIGELMLGVPREISLGPLREDGTLEILVNVVRDRTPAGYAQATKRGPRRVALPCRWNALPDADRLSFMAALDDLADSARNLFIRLRVQAATDLLLWASWVLPDDRLKFTRAADNAQGRHWAFETLFEEAL